MSNKKISAEESEEIIKRYIESLDAGFLNFKNHKKYKRMKNTFSFTLRAMSIDLMSDLLADSRIKNVFYTPSAPPPGQGMDWISFRYRVYVQYQGEN